MAASVGQLGLLARLVCPALGAATLGGSLDLDQAWCQPEPGGVLPLALPTTAIRPGADLDPLRRTIDRLVDRTAGLSVSRKLLWGNVAAAINGAVLSIRAARPELTQRATTLAGDLLRDLPAGSYTGQVGVDLRRRSCCLYYRASPTGRNSCCDECVLRR